MVDKVSFVTFYQNTIVPEQAVLICALGQAGFLIKGGGKILLIDPYLSNSVEEENPEPAGLFSRAFSPPVQPEVLTGIDLILVTHHHRDHCDPSSIVPIIKNNPSCRIIAPASSILELEQKGISGDSCISCTLGKWMSDESIAWQAIPAAHPELKLDSNGNSDYVGYLLKINGVNLYHSGDTMFYDGLAEIIKSQLDPLHIGFIVVNGRDAEREYLGIVGNMLPDEAFQLAKQTATELMIPMHNDLFMRNSVDPGEIRDIHRKNYPGQNVLWLRAGDAFLFVK
jgi:L-ascorbate metabolism protein UlaG (beta-lactamase superfamily)